MFTIKHIVALSGGKDSTAMLLKMIEKGMTIDEIIFVDTTKEFPATYEHLEHLENNIQYDITRLSFDWEYWFKDHIKTKGKNKGEKGYGWPDMKRRWCTAKKRDLIKSYLDEKYTIYEGIAYDEQNRTKNNTGKIKHIYPLVYWQITERNALQYCWNKGYDWGGLYNKMFRVSCYLCPLQNLKELRVIYEDFPNLWQEMRDLDKVFDRKFRADYSIKQLEKKFQQKRLF